MENLKEKFIYPAVIGIAAIISSVILGTFFYAAKTSGNTIRVTGAATKRITSDTAKWTFTLSRLSKGAGLQQAYLQIKQDTDRAIKKITAEGIKAEDIVVNPVNTNQQYGRDGLADQYSVQQQLSVTSAEMEKIETMARNPGLFFGGSVIVQYTNLQYMPSDLTAIKRELISEATKDALARAQEIAKKSGIHIGKLVAARTGIFQIKEPNSTEATDYGVYSTSTKDKDITVTVNAEFMLK